MHHFVQCDEYLASKYPDADLWSMWKDEASTYFSSEIDFSESAVRDFSTLCSNQKTYFPLKRIRQKYDNFKFYVRPLECKLAETTFRDMSLYGNEDVFYENCVDLEKGDPKP